MARYATLTLAVVYLAGLAACGGGSHAIAIEAGSIEAGSTEAGSTAGGDGGSSSGAPGWCYLTGAAAGGCSQSLAFSSTEAPEAGALLWLACPETVGSGSDASAPSDGEAAPAGDGGPQDAAPPEFVVGFSPANGACLASALPVAATGMTACEILEAFPAATGESYCNGVAGLSTPDGAALSAVRARAAVAATTPICELTQLPASSTSGTCPSGG